MHLTLNEINGLKLCLNYDSRQAQLSDNYSNGCKQAFATLFGGSLKAAGGLMSSLTQKDLGYEEEGIFWLTDLGVNTIFDLLEKNA